MLSKETEKIEFKTSTAELKDAWGSGLRRINEHCKKENIKIEYRIEPNGLFVIFYRPHDLVNDPVNVPLNVPLKKASDNIIDYEKILLKFFLENKNLKLKDLSIQLGVAEKTIKRYVKKLKTQNKIKRIGSDKTGYWKVIK